MTRSQWAILALLGLAVLITYSVGIITVASNVLANPEPLPDVVAVSGPTSLATTPAFTATPMSTWTPMQTAAPTATATLVVPWTPTATSTGTPTATFTPAPTAMPTATLTPSPTAMPTATSTSLPTQIRFYAEKSSLVAGECTDLYWYVNRAQAVYLNGTGVAGLGRRRVCPDKTTVHTLRVIHRDGHETVHTVTLEVTPLPLPLPLPMPLPEFPTSKGVSLAYGYCQDVARLGGGWNYNWKTEPIPGCEAGFVPMIWGRFSEMDLRMAIPWATWSGWLLGFNEPDRPEQANIAPEEAATLWRQIEEARPSGVGLVSPVTAQGNLNWLRQWRSAYYAQYNEYPHVDAWAFHYYGGSADDLLNALNTLIAQLDAWGEPDEVWVTEFGRCDSEGGRFMDDVIKAFKANPRVTRYAWFTNRLRGDEPCGDSCIGCRLLTMEGQITPFGQRYITY